MPVVGDYRHEVLVIADIIDICDAGAGVLLIGGYLLNYQVDIGTAHKRAVFQLEALNSGCLGSLIGHMD